MQGGKQENNTRKQYDRSTSRGREENLRGREERKRREVGCVMEEPPKAPMHAKPKHISLSFTFCGNWRSVGSSSQTQGTTTWKTTPVATMADQKVVWFPGALPFRPAHHMHYSSWLKFEICPTSITIRIVLPMKRCLPVQVSSRRNWPTARPTACRSCTQIRCRKIPSLFSNTRWWESALVCGNIVNFPHSWQPHDSLRALNNSLMRSILWPEMRQCVQRLIHWAWWWL